MTSHSLLLLLLLLLLLCRVGFGHGCRQILGRKVLRLGARRVAVAGHAHPAPLLVLLDDGQATHGAFVRLARAPGRPKIIIFQRSES